MSTEELKMILEAIGGLGNAGISAFTWYLILDFIKHFTTVAGLVVLVVGVARQIRRGIEEVNKQ